MNLNEKTAANHSDGLHNFNERLNSTPRGAEMQQVLNFGTPPKVTTTYGRKWTRKSFNLRQIVCEVCCAPLYLYSETFVAAFLDDRAELPPLLCDNHLSEMEQEVATS
jgi:hypothetical protein